MGHLGWSSGWSWFSWSPLSFVICLTYQLEVGWSRMTSCPCLEVGKLLVIWPNSPAHGFSSSSRLGWASSHGGLRIQSTAGRWAIKHKHSKSLLALYLLSHWPKWITWPNLDSKPVQSHTAKLWAELMANFCNLPQRKRELKNSSVAIWLVSCRARILVLSFYLWCHILNGVFKEWCLNVVCEMGRGWIYSQKESETLS